MFRVLASLDCLRLDFCEHSAGLIRKIHGSFTNYTFHVNLLRQATSYLTRHKMGHNTFPKIIRQFVHIWAANFLRYPKVDLFKRFRLNGTINVSSLLLLHTNHKLRWVVSEDTYAHRILFEKCGKRKVKWVPRWAVFILFYFVGFCRRVLIGIGLWLHNLFSLWLCKKISVT